jgi:hypothetical protein
MTHVGMWRTYSNPDPHGVSQNYPSSKPAWKRVLKGIKQIIQDIMEQYYSLFLIANKVIIVTAEFEK